MATASDDFNRPDGPGLGPNWTVPAGALRTRISAYACGALGTSGPNVGVWNAATFGADQYADARIAALSIAGPECGVIVRAALAAVTHYRFGAAPPEPPDNGWEIKRIVAGSSTLLAYGGAGVVSAGDRIRLEVETTGASVTLRAYSGVGGDELVTTYVDTHADRLTTGQPGIFFIGEYDNNALDDWSGGDLVTVPPEPVPPAGTVGSRAGSALGTVRRAVVARLLADEALLALLGGEPALYAPVAPQGAAVPFLTYAVAGESPVNQFRRGGRDVTLTLVVEAAELAALEALTHRVFELLDQTRLDLAPAWSPGILTAVVSDGPTPAVEDGVLLFSQILTFRIRTWATGQAVA